MQSKQGFTLVEVLMVIGLLTILSIGSIILMSSTADEARFQKTTKQLSEIREALLGKWDPQALSTAPGLALSQAWAPQAAGLIGLWHLDETAPANLADTSASAHPGTTVGTVRLNSPGQIKTSLQASSGGFQSAIDLSAVTTVTLMAWVNYAACADPTECILWEFTPNSTASFGFHAAFSDNSSGVFPAGSFTIGQTNTAGRMVKYTAPLSPGWHHVAVIYDRSAAAANTLSLFLDGSALTLTATTLNNSSGNTFGNSTLYFLGRGATTLFSNASIDEVALWNRALLASEIQAIYKKQFSNSSLAQRKYFGYLGDIGALPTLAQGIPALVTNPGLPVFAVSAVTRMGIGWNGPYLNQGSAGTDLAGTYSKDAWGNAYVYDPTTTPVTLKSYGADGAAGGTGLNADISVNLPASLLSGNIKGVILNQGAEWSGDAQVELNYPNGSGALTQVLATVIPANKGGFSFASVPLGVRSATVYIPSKAAPTTTQGPFLITVDRAFSPALLQTNF